MNTIKYAKRIALKIGSSSLTHETGKLNLRKLEILVRVLSDFKNGGKEVVLISSGAVSAGFGRLNADHRPKTRAEKQAYAAVGQTELMRMYEQFFSHYGHSVGQILLTKDVVDHPVMRENAENTFETLFSLGCVPIVNENDSISFEELEFGGNDTLAAYVSLICRADVLINLSDIDGLYDSDPRKNPDAKLVETVTDIDAVMSYAGGAGSERGTGGMITKLKAAKIVTNAGIPMFIVNGRDPEILYQMQEGGARGTYFAAKVEK